MMMIMMVTVMKVIIFRMTKNGKFCDNGDDNIAFTRFCHGDDFDQVVDNGDGDPVKLGQFCSLDCFPSHCQKSCSIL